MKILLLADCESAHTIKWATSLAEHGFDLIIFSLGNFTVNDYINYKNIKVINLSQETSGNEGSFIKIKYLKALPTVKKIISEFKPNIVHAHYATSYGLLGSMSNFHPFILSVWGNDIFSFPQKSYFHKALIEYNLKNSDKLLSTSHIMKIEANKYTKKNIEVTPFGIDIRKFKPITTNSLFEKDDIIIGTVKTLEEKYGIEYLIKAFKIVSDKYHTMPLKLLIVGGGSLEFTLKSLVKELSLEEKTVFTGRIPFVDVPKYQNMLTVSVSLSINNSESFGVAILEASACGKPVIVSNVGGLPEVVEDGVTGIVVTPRDSKAAARAIECLILDKELRLKMGNAGRERVKQLYNWESNVKQMIGIYQQFL